MMKIVHVLDALNSLRTTGLKLKAMYNVIIIDLEKGVFQTGTGITPCRFFNMTCILNRSY